MLVAVSGGVDSTVLAHALAALRERCDLKLAIAHVDHGLRGEQSDGDRESVGELAARLQLPFFVRHVEPEILRVGGSSRTRPTIQEAARQLRYSALLSLCDESGCQFVATAHHADDQAETVLLRLLRGCGPDGLGGIPERSRGGRVVRPLLGVSRAEIEEYARRSDLAWREDSSNGNLRYARNRLRHRWLPGLARDFNPQLLRAIANLAEAHRRDAEWMDALVSAEAAHRFTRVGEEMQIARGGWSELPEALVRRLARRALLELGGGRDMSRTHLERFVDFLRGARPGTAIELPGGLRLACDGEGFRLRAGRVEAQTAC